MQQIKAFVGHSFTEDDELLISSFLKMFEQIRGVLPSFVYQNAQAAEPEILANKVQRLMADSNTFIGICTKKEFVVDPSAQSNLLGFSVYRKDHLTWKTSDWLIQEIGIAIGRAMSMVILLEEGCRLPGSLQGDVEYITFSRQAPEKAFGKLLEMLKALNPTKLTSLDNSTELENETDFAPLNKSERPVSIDIDRNPDETWSFNAYLQEYIWLLATNEFDRAEEISNAFAASTHGQTDEALSEWKAKCEESKLIFSSSGNLSEIADCVQKYPDNPKILSYYASALRIYKENSVSAQYYVLAAEKTKDTFEMVSHLMEAAIGYARANDLKSGSTLIEQAKQYIKTDIAIEISFLKALSLYADEVSDSSLKIEALERVVLISPGDDDARFSLAYAHSEFGNQEMALHHYTAIPYARRTNFTWNNLGVAYQSLSVPARAVAAYGKAAEDGNTLAMSNLAYRLMQAGFVNEARERLEKALQDANPHKNVGEAYAELRDIEENENTTVKKILDTASSKIEWYRELGTAICKDRIPNVNQIWSGPHGDFIIEITDNIFSARYEYVVKNNALALSSAITTTSRYECVFKGHMLGHRATGEFKKTRIGSTASSLLGDLDFTKVFTLIFNDGFDEAEVIEDVKSTSLSRYRIRLDKLSNSSPSD
ncbi:tetratricopeptide repeat protein [Erythrobacter donghaensis]|uniref:tetratricopeptide repeat protein n=1 Tax=Erythrobacter donghaensis TaxID=267135 RepID=UPI00117C50E0|nr:tetratricopeptide repeat protein [Erythrobacter donghaensis]